MTSTWQDPRPGCSSHNKLGLRQEVGEGGKRDGREMDWIVRPTTTAGELGRPQAVSAGRRGQGHRWLRDRGCLISASHPPALYVTAQSPGPWASLDRISKADNERHLIWEFVKRRRAGVGGLTSNPTALATGTGRAPAVSGHRPPGAGFL